MPSAGLRLASRGDRMRGRWGRLYELEPLRLRKLTADGMLLESPSPLAVGSAHEFQLGDGETSVSVLAAVRHLSPRHLSSTDLYFLIELEFLNLSRRTALGIERLIHDEAARAASEVA